MTEEEIRSLIHQGHYAGVLPEVEAQMMERVMRLRRTRVGDLMTPHAAIVWLDVADPDEVNWRKIVASTHTYFPVYEGTRENLLGLVSVKALWANLAAGVPARLRDVAMTPLIVPETMTAIRLLETFKKQKRHLALVCDEFGHISGLVTLIDVLEAIVGALPEEGPPPRRLYQKRDDGSWLIDGMIETDAFKELLRLPELPRERTDHFRTLGGFIMSYLGRIPEPGDAFVWQGWRFEVLHMDGHRIDKVRLTPAGTRTSPPAP